MTQGRPMIDDMPQGGKEVMVQLGPVLVGTAVQMLFVKGAWKRRLTQGVVGVPFSFYMAPFVERVISRYGWHVTSAEAGVLTAVFGLALVSYIFEVWQQLSLGTMIRDWIANKLGVSVDKTNT